MVEEAAEAEIGVEEEVEAETRPEPAEAADKTATKVTTKDLGQVGVPEDPATLTTHPVTPVESIGSSGRGRGIARTDTIVHGETLKTPSPHTTETLSPK